MQDVARCLGRRVGLALALALIVSVAASASTMRSADAVGLARSHGVTVAATQGLAPMTETGSGSGQGAGWLSDESTTSIAATVTVPVIDCSSIQSGDYAGQSDGVTLDAQGDYTPFASAWGDFAGVYTYCDGGTAHYEPEFITADPGQETLTFSQPDLSIAPGHTLELLVEVDGGNTDLSITDTNSPAAPTVTTTGPALEPTGWDVGDLPLVGDGQGRPLLNGSWSLPGDGSLQLLPGPVSADPALFTDVSAGGQPITDDSDLYSTNWYSSSAQPVLQPSSVVSGTASSSGDEFTAYFTAVPKPALGKSSDLAPSGGKVLVELPGTHKFVRLKSVRRLPLGTLINAIHGSVQMTVALPRKGTQSGIFWAGEFKVGQSRHTGHTTVRLKGGDFGLCTRDSTASAHDVTPAGRRSGVSPLATIAKKKKKKKKKIRKLWANAHGSFSTDGSYGAAAVEGTRWLTEDLCDGTFFRVTRDKIEVTAYYPHRHRVLVTQGHTFLAPAP